MLWIRCAWPIPHGQFKRRVKFWWGDGIIMNYNIDILYDGDYMYIYIEEKHGLFNDSLFCIYTSWNIMWCQSIKLTNFRWLGAFSPGLVQAEGRLAPWVRQLGRRTGERNCSASCYKSHRSPTNEIPKIKAWTQFFVKNFSLRSIPLYFSQKSISAS